MKYLLLLPSFLLFICACSGGKTSEADEDSTSVMKDSGVFSQEMPRLPDTAYISADVVKYQVEICDSALSTLVTPLKDLYDSSVSVMTFRKGPFRQADYGVVLDSMPTEIEVAWRFDTDLNPSDKVYGRWGGGTGWTGQPLYIEWPDSLASKLKSSGLVTADFNGREVMFGSLIGKVYFLNPDNGKITRHTININNPIKGTMSFDPTFNGNLYVGQGIPAVRPFGSIVIDLFSNTVSHTFGEDRKAYRQWGAYDSSAIRVGQFLFRPAENGGLYKFAISPGTLILQSVLRYRVNGSSPGIESSMAVYGNYGIVADNHGGVMAVNLDTMKPVWYYDMGDDTDATPVIAIEENIPYVYLGCEIDLNDRGYAKFAKLNVLNGKEEWAIQVKGQRKNLENKHFDGGFYASPLLGKGNCEGLIFTNVVKNTSGQNGAFIAIDRKNGTIKYEIPLKHYSWSSPVGALTRDGRMVVVTGDGLGNIYIIDAAAGEIKAVKSVGNNFESSPILINNSIFIGSRTNGLFKLNLK